MHPGGSSKRKSTPRVRDGKAQRKNRAEPTPNYWNTKQEEFVIDREKPGRGYRHLLSKDDISRFIQIIPGWDAISEGLDAIVLASGDSGLFGWHNDGVVGICAWERDLWLTVDTGFASEHRGILDRLSVETHPLGHGDIECRFDERSIRHFQLMHILLHELGHHHDRMSNGNRERASRGEGFAEQFANQLADSMWDQYFREFDM